LQTLLATCRMQLLLWLEFTVCGQFRMENLFHCYGFCGSFHFLD